MTAGEAVPPHAGPPVLAAQSMPPRAIDEAPPVPWRTIVRVCLLATALGLLVSLAGVLTVQPGLPAWPRLWASAFFVLLLWPVGLGLVGRLAGVRAEGAAAALLLVLAAVQQSGAGSMPLPLVVTWSVALQAPGDAIRQRILLPPPADGRWQRAWREASRAAVVICTETAVPSKAAVQVRLSGGAPAALDSLPRSDTPQTLGWYAVPATRSVVESSRTLEVEVERLGASGPPALLCGGQDDPGRRGAFGSARRIHGQWVSQPLTDRALPLVGGRPPLGRYYIELRFYDSDEKPSLGVWY